MSPRAAHVEGAPLPAEVVPVSRAIAGLARSRPERIAVRFGAYAVTYVELDRQVGAALALFDRLQLRAGDRVAYLGQNHPRFIPVLLAAMRADLQLVPLNWRLKPRELAFLLADSGASLVFVDDAFTALIDGSWRTVVNDAGEQSLDAILATGAHHADWVERFGHPDRASLLLYTSGTTGKPKGAETSERAISFARAQEKAMSGFADWTDGEVLLSPLPLFHIGGISWALCGIERGCTLVLSTDTSPAGILDECLANEVTRTFMVPQLVRALIEEMNARGVSGGSLRAIHYGAAAMDPALLERALSHIGCRFLQYFGMTEMTGTVTILPPEDHDMARPGLLRSVGTVLPGAALQIRDAEGGVVPRGVDGEIWATGPTMMLGYRGLPDATAEALVDGWYRTGDGGRIDDDGFLFLTDRIKDMIVSGGENVYPVEVEAVLREHPAVIDAAVYGLPDPLWGERVCAAIERRDGSDVETAAILAFVREQIAGYKCPKTIEIVSGLPRTASGKVQRGKVRAEALGAE